MSLAWGRRNVMVEPTHFRVDYVINPFMDPSDQPDRELALAQWYTLVETIERLGGTVEVIPQRPDAPDMVYAMNLGLAAARSAASPTRWTSRSVVTCPRSRAGPSYFRRTEGRRRRASL